MLLFIVLAEIGISVHTDCSAIHFDLWLVSISQFTVMFGVLRDFMFYPKTQEHLFSRNE